MIKFAQATYFKGKSAVGMSMVDTMLVFRWAGPPLGGQMPSATALIGALLRDSTLGEAQILVKRKGPSIAITPKSNIAEIQFRLRQRAHQQNQVV
jgi:hypothetical protein